MASLMVSVNGREWGEREKGKQSPVECSTTAWSRGGAVRFRPGRRAARGEKSRGAGAGARVREREREGMEMWRDGWALVGRIWPAG
jgi:hypothetical protein